MTGRFGKYGDFKRKQRIRKNLLKPGSLMKVRKGTLLKKMVRIKTPISVIENTADTERHS